MRGSNSGKIEARVRLSDAESGGSPKIPQAGESFGKAPCPNLAPLCLKRDQTPPQKARSPSKMIMYS